VSVFLFLKTASKDFALSTARLDQQLCFALYSASNRLTRIYRPLLEPLGLTYTQFVVLMALWEKESISISQLAAKTGLTKATMTPLLKRLEQKELIERQRLTGNDRQKNVVLTDQGRELSRQSEEITHQAYCRTGLTKKQANDLIATCREILKKDIP